MSKIRVGVLRGGPSSEHDVSLKTGENILECLPKEKYEGVDVVLSKEGNLSVNGSFLKFHQLNYAVDVIFNALHGYFGEDGKIQHLLESARLPYNGSGALASSVGMNKILSRGFFAKAGFKIPRAEVIRKDESLEQGALRVFRAINPSWVVKPASCGSSIGVSIADNFDDLVLAIENSFKFDSSVIVEECIKGREATCGIIENFRGEEHYALPVIEIIPHEKSRFFDYGSKYDGSTQEICPADFDLITKKDIEELARKAHQILGCRDYSRTDMVVSPRGIYLLEINTLPGFTSESLFPKSARAVGLEFSDLLDHIITLTLNRYHRF